MRRGVFSPATEYPYGLTALLAYSVPAALVLGSMRQSSDPDAVIAAWGWHAPRHCRLQPLTACTLGPGSLTRTAAYMHLVRGS